MRPILFALSAALLLTASSSLAKPTKKPVPAAAKKPPTSPIAPSVPVNDSPAPSASTDSGGAPSVRGPTRIDFDDRLIQGQSNKSGAVYLYDRKELKIRSMIKKRDNFRDEIVGSLYDT
jgi:hypothetical protein